MKWWIIYFFIGVCATGITLITTPICRNISWKLDILDIPLGEFHKKHGESTPLLGGIAMLSGWIITVYGGLLYCVKFQHMLPDELIHRIPGILSVQSLLYVITAGAIALTIMGLIDDKKPLGPLVKFIMQFVICSIVASYPKIRVTIFVETPIITWAITVCWFMFIINAFNFFDNMDGLASGTAFIAAVLFTLVAAFGNQIFVAALGAATAGAASGFYFYNRYPASIFMGDSGSYFLGYMLAVIGTLTMFYHPATSPTPAPLLIPILVLAVIIFDTFAVVIIRLKKGVPIYYGDHNHISHRFHDMGVSKKQAVFIVHMLALSIGLGAITLMWLDSKGVVLVLIQSSAMLLLVVILHHIKKRDDEK